MSKNLIGEKFGRLTVKDQCGRHKKRILWLCCCECGGETKATSTSLLTGVKKSCGCLASEVLRNRCLDHGMSNTTAHKRWSSMIDRCYNKKSKDYQKYGGRGIRVCDTWKNDFKKFYKDMGEPTSGMSLDRVNTNGDYEPENCRWATKQEQSRNRRTSKIWHIKGEIFKTCIEAAEHFKVTHQAIIGWVKNRSDCKSTLIYRGHE